MKVMVINIYRLWSMISLVPNTISIGCCQDIVSCTRTSSKIKSRNYLMQRILVCLMSLIEWIHTCQSKGKWTSSYLNSSKSMHSKVFWQNSFHTSKLQLYSSSKASRINAKITLYKTTSDEKKNPRLAERCTDGQFHDMKNQVVESVTTT